MSSLNHYDVIRKPILTEKATDLREKRGQVCFKVDGRSNKKQVAEAIEKIFNVKVVRVRILNTSPKPRKLGQYAGTRPGYKKAIVTLEEDNTIDIFEKVT